MANQHTLLNRNTAIEYCDKFPDSPNMTLAKKMYKENTSVFSTLESARSAIRYVRGQAGSLSRKKINDKSRFKEAGDKNPWKDFDSDAKEPNVFKLPKSLKKVLVLGDIHIPYHDITAIKAAINYGKAVGIDCVYINGDLLDFYQLSSFEKDPRKRGFQGELELCRQFFLIY
jgi:hypothetical protein